MQTLLFIGSARLSRKQMSFYLMPIDRRTDFKISNLEFWIHYGSTCTLLPRIQEILQDVK